MVRGSVMPIVTPPNLAWAPPPIGSYLAPSSLEAMARGIGSLVEYGGLILNDRRAADRYHVTEMTGLRGGVDIRDNRSSLPSQDGEAAYDSFYGGRTLTITGVIRSGSYAQAQQMAQDLETAFSGLGGERPLKMRWWDVFDDYSDSSTLGYYTYTGSQPSVQGGLLYPGDSPSILVHQMRRYTDSRVTARFVIASPVSNSATMGVVAKYTPNGLSYLQAQARNIGGAISLVASRYDASNGGSLQLGVSAGTIPSREGMQLWIRLATVEDDVVAELWTVDPFYAGGASPALSVVVRLQGNDADVFGALASGSSGITSQQPTSGAWYVDDLRIESIWPGDQVLQCKPISDPSIKTAIPTRLDVYEAGFQIGLRASDPRWTSSVALARVVPPNAGAYYGRVYNTVFPFGYTIPISAQGQALPPYISPNVVVTNRGKWTAKPTIRLYGQMQAPVVTNLTNGQRLVLRGVIPNGDYIDVNFAAGTMVNSAGDDMFNMLVPASNWPVLLEPGENYLSCSSVAISGAANCVVAWSHSTK